MRGMVVVVMGVAGVGKTTVGRRLADQLGWPFHDADDLHDTASVERMRRGEPLTDDHRAPWLASLATLIAEHLRQRRPMVLACSALSRAHRAALLSLAPEPGDVGLVHLRADAALLGERLARRTGHFFSPDLLADQLATLEEPEPYDAAAAAAGAGPAALVLDGSRPVSELVAAIRDAFGV
jgi:gluconokinase